MSARVLRILIASGVTMVVAGAILLSRPAKRLTPGIELEPGVMDTIDFAELDPDIANFLERAGRERLIGMSLVEFSELWPHAHTPNPADNGIRRQYRRFSLPMTAERRKELDRLIAGAAGVPCWPVLMVEVDTETSKILRVAVITQCL